MNTGVMLMNLHNLAAKNEKFRAFIVKKLELLTKASWDQCAYQIFYRRRFTNRPQWDKLAIEYNWKPYWGDYSSAKMVHFHGPKPFQRELAQSDKAPQSLKELAKGSYAELCSLWDKMLAEAS